MADWSTFAPGDLAKEIFKKLKGKILTSQQVIRTCPTTAVPSGADLNTDTYLVVGTYYSYLAANSFKNSPTSNGAWMMVVIAPLGGDETPRTVSQMNAATWVYRVRYLIAGTSGHIYVQRVSSGSTAGKYTYGAWEKIAPTDIPSTVTASTKLSTARKINGVAFDGTKDITIPTGGNTVSTQLTLTASNWTGSAAPYTYDLGSTYANKSVVVGYDGSKYSEESYTAACDAGPILGGSGTQIYAYGEKPTVDIPVIIQYG